MNKKSDKKKKRQPEEYLKLNIILTVVMGAVAIIAFLLVKYFNLPI